MGYRGGGQDSTDTWGQLPSARDTVKGPEVTPVLGDDLPSDPTLLSWSRWRLGRWGSPGSGVSGPLQVLLRLDRAQLRVAHKRSLWGDIPLIHEEKSQVQQVSRVPYKVCSDTHSLPSPGDGLIWETGSLQLSPT